MNIETTNFENFDDFIASKLQEMNETQYDWEAISLGIGIVASTINEDNGHEVIYDYFDEAQINECIEVLNEYELDDAEIDYCLECVNNYLNECGNIVDVAPEKRQKHIDRENKKEAKRKAIYAKLQPHKELDRVEYKNENYDWEAISLGLGIIASTINEDNNHAEVYDYFTEQEIDECVDVLNEYELDDAEIDYCVDCFNEFLNEQEDKPSGSIGGTVGAIGLGMGVNVAMKNKHNKRLQQLRDQGASDKEINKTRRRQNFVRGVSTLGSAISGAVIGKQAEKGLRNFQKNRKNERANDPARQAKENYKQAKNQYNKSQKTAYWQDKKNSIGK